MFVFLYVFVTLIDLGAQIRGSQTRYTVVNFDLNQSLALLTIYKCFVRTHVDYDDIIYDQAFNNSFHQEIESLQYDAALAIAGAIRGTLREKNLSRIRFRVPPTKTLV